MRILPLAILLMLAAVALSDVGAPCVDASDCSAGEYCLPPGQCAYDSGGQAPSQPGSGQGGGTQYPEGGFSVNETASDEYTRSTFIPPFGGDIGANGSVQPPAQTIPPANLTPETNSSGSNQSNQNQPEETDSLKSNGSLEIEERQEGAGKNNTNTTGELPLADENAKEVEDAGKDASGIPNLILASLLPAGSPLLSAQSIFIFAGAGLIALLLLAALALVLVFVVRGKRG